jgi:hypothetical protein
MYLRDTAEVMVEFGTSRLLRSTASNRNIMSESQGESQLPTVGPAAADLHA